jgi:N-acetylglucosaminyldiphosphoundecaprenol N-acetyl-beta-D-mannosaminyltransferase
MNCGGIQYPQAGLGVKQKTWDSAKEAVRAGISLHEPVQVVTLTPEMCVMASRDETFLNIINNAGIVVSDGVGVVWGEGKITGRKPEKIPGIELASWAIEEAARRNGRIFLLGAKEEIVAKASENLKMKYPGIIIKGWKNGYFKPEDEPAIIAAIASAAPHLLLVGLGSPKQEYFIASHLSELNCGVAIGVGGSFDVWSGTIKRAPMFFQKTGTEWLYRTFTQPGARFRRLYLLWKFIWLVSGNSGKKKGK